MVRGIVVLLKERLQVLLDLPGQYILIDLIGQFLLIIGFDDAVDLLINVPGEQIRECHLRLLRFHIKTLLACCGVLVEVFSCDYDHSESIRSLISIRSRAR